MNPNPNKLESIIGPGEPLIDTNIETEVYLVELVGIVGRRLTSVVDVPGTVTAFKVYATVGNISRAFVTDGESAWAVVGARRIDTQRAYWHYLRIADRSNDNSAWQFVVNLPKATIMEAIEKFLNE